MFMSPLNIHGVGKVIGAFVETAVSLAKMVFNAVHLKSSTPEVKQTADKTLTVANQKIETDVKNPPQVDEVNFAPAPPPPPPVINKARISNEIGKKSLLKEEPVDPKIAPTTPKELGKSQKAKMVEVWTLKKMSVQLENAKSEMEDIKLKLSQTSESSVTKVLNELKNDWDNKIKDLESKIEEQTALVEDMREGIKTGTETMIVKKQEAVISIKDRCSDLEKEIKLLKESNAPGNETKLRSLEKQLAEEKEKLKPLDNELFKLGGSLIVNNHSMNIESRVVASKYFKNNFVPEKTATAVSSAIVYAQKAEVTSKKADFGASAELKAQFEAEKNMQARAEKTQVASSKEPVESSTTDKAPKEKKEAVSTKEGSAKKDKDEEISIKSENVSKKGEAAQQTQTTTAPLSSQRTTVGSEPITGGDITMHLSTFKEKSATLKEAANHLNSLEQEVKNASEKVAVSYNTAVKFQTNLPPDVKEALQKGDISLLKGDKSKEALFNQSVAQTAALVADTKVLLALQPKLETSQKNLQTASENVNKEIGWFEENSSEIKKITSESLTEFRKAKMELSKGDSPVNTVVVDIDIQTKIQMFAQKGVESMFYQNLGGVLHYLLTSKAPTTVLGGAAFEQTKETSRKEATTVQAGGGSGSGTGGGGTDSGGTGQQKQQQQKQEPEQEEV